MIFALKMKSRNKKLMFPVLTEVRSDPDQFHDYSFTDRHCNSSDILYPENLNRPSYVSISDNIYQLLLSLF